MGVCSCKGSTDGAEQSDRANGRLAEQQKSQLRSNSNKVARKSETEVFLLIGEAAHTHTHTRVCYTYIHTYVSAHLFHSGKFVHCFDYLKLEAEQILTYVLHSTALKFSTTPIHPEAPLSLT